METPKPINPKSARARKLASSVAKAFNDRLFQGVASGRLPGYAVRAEAKEIRAGSIDVLLQLVVEIMLGPAGGAIALGAFAKAYPGIKAGILDMANDMSTITDVLYGIVDRSYPVNLKAERLWTGEEMASKLKEKGIRFAERVARQKAEEQTKRAANQKAEADALRAARQKEEVAQKAARAKGSKSTTRSVVPR